MSLLAYCILAPPAGGCSLPAEIAGRAVRLASDGALAAAVSEVAAAPPVDAAQALAFEAVVEWLHAHLPAVIPVRFGSVFADEAAVVSRLRRGAAEYARLLAELEDAAEVGIRVLAGEPSAPTASGAAWLRARRRQYLRLDEIAAQLRSEFAGIFRRSCQEVAAGMLSIYFLVPRTNAVLFLERARQVRLKDARLLVSGPWPPYNFAVTENVR